MKLQRSFLKVGRYLFVALVMVYVGSNFGKAHFVLDLLSNFKVHFAVAFLFFAAVFVAMRSPAWCAVAVAGVVVNAMPVLAWYGSPFVTPERETGTAKHLMVSNVFMRNTRYDGIEILVDAEQPDILGLIEVNQAWLDNIRGIRSLYPYRFEWPQQNYFGLALFSKVPFTNAQIVYFGDAATPAITADFTLRGSSFRLILTHPMPPMDARRAALRNAQLREIAEFVHAADGAVLLAGDLNTTMWSPYYGEFAERSGLVNARSGYGAGGTWPPIPFISVPIDHILSTGPLQVQNFRVHHGIGSDHLPISADILMPAAAESCDEAGSCATYTGGPVPGSPRDDRVTDQTSDIDSQRSDAAPGVAGPAGAHLAERRPGVDRP